MITPRRRPSSIEPGKTIADIPLGNCPKCTAPLILEEEIDIVDELTKFADQSNSKVEIISDDFEEGSILYHRIRRDCSHPPLQDGILDAHDMYTIIETAIKETTGVTDALLTDGGENMRILQRRSHSRSQTEETGTGQDRTGSCCRTCKNDLNLRGSRLRQKARISISSSGRTTSARQCAKPQSSPAYGNLPKKPTRVVLEHTSANPNGPLHVGHIRNSIIGDTLARAFRKAGYPLEVQYYVNDMGRQIAIVVWGFDNLDSKQIEGEKEDAHIARIYIAANREIEKDESITQQVNTLMQLVENGDPATVKKFRREVSRCLDGFKVTMKDLNVAHDRFVWESDFIRNGNTERIINKLKRLPQARDEETLALDLSEFGFENKYVHPQERRHLGLCSPRPCLPCMERGKLRPGHRCARC